MQIKVRDLDCDIALMELPSPASNVIGSMFGGMEVQATDGVAPVVASAFSFMAAEEAPTSAFTFIQETPTDEPAASGFTFLSAPADSEPEPIIDAQLTSFSFISEPQATNVLEVQSD
jgi:hypothetical protein